MSQKFAPLLQNECLYFPDKANVKISSAEESNIRLSSVTKMLLGLIVAFFVDPEIENCLTVMLKAGFL
jgi:hypothetical protein